MPLSQIDICSKSLLKIGANSISSFDEGTIEAEIAAKFYPIIRDALLSLHPWNFATFQTNLGRLTRAPLADFSVSFQMPMDCLRVLAAGSAPRGRGLTYRIAGTQLHCDSDDVVLTYVRRASEADFPPYFTLALVAFLAAEFCIPLTDSTSRWEGLRSLADAEIRRAKLIDAQEEPAPHFEDFLLVEERS
jgi:hypothetical protein